MRSLFACLVTLLLHASTQLAVAQPQAGALGTLYDNRIGGIALQPPANCETIRHTGTDPIVEFVNEDKGWRLAISRLTLDETQPWNDKIGPGGEIQTPGMLARQVSEFQKNASNVEVLRSDLVNLGRRDMGMVAIRYGMPLQRRLLQRAMILDANRVYFILDFTSLSSTELPEPTDEPVDPDLLPPDPLEVEAVSVFQQVIDTVRIYDRSDIRKDQDDRLTHARALYPNFDKRHLSEALVPDRWLRIIRDGKDIGFSHVAETLHNNAGSDGVLIAVRTRTFPDDSSQVDVGSSQFVSFNLRHEIWSSDGVVRHGSEATAVTEQGTADRRVRRWVQKGDPLNPDAPAESQIKNAEEYVMTVTRFEGNDRGDTTPRTWALPDYYLPQAVGHLLPRLLPDERQTYLFVSFISEQQELMFRYVDVEPNVEVRIDGEMVTATAIHDRIGLEGDPTIHYVSPAGELLGSYSEIAVGDKRTSLWVIPSDAETVEKLWKGQQREDKGAASSAPPVAVPAKPLK